jgi:lipid-A-disaccharide synthase-like uncharacterized protein
MFDFIVRELLKDPVWMTLGFAGQVVFGSRFVLQWLVSEYKKKSHIPVAFWYLSLVGSIILLAYSIHKKDPIFILGFSLNAVIYIRNLHLIYKHKQTGEVTMVEKDED